MAVHGCTGDHVCGFLAKIYDELCTQTTTTICSASSCDVYVYCYIHTVSRLFSRGWFKKSDNMCVCTAVTQKCGEQTATGPLTPLRALLCTCLTDFGVTEFPGNFFGWLVLRVLSQPGSMPHMR